MSANPQSRYGTPIFVGGILLVILAVGLGYVLILRPSVPPPPKPKPVVSKPAGAQLTRAAGVVQMRFGGGDWEDAAIGAPVAPGTDVRTGEGASAALSYPGTLDVEVASDADFRLEQVDDTVAKLVVKDGLVIADVKPESGRLLQMAVEGSDAVAETRDGRVHVLSDGKGNVQAAVTRGTATVTAAGEKVELQTGYQTSVAPGRAPGKPSLMPKSLLLRIKWPPDKTTAKRRQLVVGTTNPGARVRVGHAFTIADGKGQFRAVVELNEGVNQLNAFAIDVFGRGDESRSPAIELDTRAPYQEIKTDPGMWKQKTDK